jgi:DHA1 family bicyclomycin/chloramphenicol resistance-like MFS transporter
MALLVTLMATSQLAIMMFLPSLPSMAGDLATSQTLVQMTVSVYLGAFALAQLVIGPLSDALGRRGPLLTGLALFVLGSLACAFAPDIGWLIAARVVQAVGGCACIVVARAIVRDTTDGDAATRAMAYLGMSLALAPMVGPLIGGQLETLFGWQSNFLFVALLGAGTLLVTLFTLAETLPPEVRHSARPAALLRTYLRLLGMARFMGFSLSAGAMAATFQAFIAGSPIALIVVMGVSPEQYGLFLLSAPIGYMLGNFLSSRLARRVPRNRMIWTGSIIAIANAAAMAGLALAGMDTPWTLLIPICVYSIGSGLLVPNCLAGALISIEPAVAGSAAALGGFLQMGAGFLSATVIALLTQTSFLQLGSVMTACTVLSLLFFAVLVARR